MRRTLLSVGIAALVALATFAVPAAAQAATTSTFLAGYRTSQIGISRASATVTAPSVTCDPSVTQGIAFGIGNEASPGNLTMLAGVRILCSSGSPQVFGYAFGTAAHVVQLGGVASGDRFSLLVTQTQRAVKITAKDLSTGGVFQVSGAPVPDNTLTFGAFPLESGSTPLPVPNFGSVVIGKSVLENTPLVQWSPTQLNRVNGATTQISTGPIVGNGAFRLTYKSS